MKILSLSVEGFRGCPDGTYRFGDGNSASPFIAIVGDGGSGKTSLLEAVALAKEGVGPYGRAPRPIDVTRAGASRTALEARWELSESERTGTDLDVNVTTSLAFDEAGLTVEAPATLKSVWAKYTRGNSKAEYFPASRRLGRFPDQPLPLAIGSFHDRLARVDGKYDWIAAYFVSEETREAANLARRAAERGVVAAGELRSFREAVNTRLARLSTDLRYLGTGPANGKTEPLFLKRTGTEVPLSCLSSTEEQAVLFVGASLHLGLDLSLLLIDTPELCFHPTRHQGLAEGLLALGEDNQVVVATSSERFASTASAQIRLTGGG